MSTTFEAVLVALAEETASSTFLPIIPETKYLPDLLFCAMCMGYIAREDGAGPADLGAMQDMDMFASPVASDAACVCAVQAADETRCLSRALDACVCAFHTLLGKKASQATTTTTTTILSQKTHGKMPACWGCRVYIGSVSTRSYNTTSVG